MRIFTNGKFVDPSAGQVLAETPIFENEGEKSIDGLISADVDCEVLLEYLDADGITVKLPIHFFVGAHKPYRFETGRLQDFQVGEKIKLSIVELVSGGQVQGIVFVSSL